MTGQVTYENSANIKWRNGPGAGIGASSGGVGVGYNAIGKSGVADTSDASVLWTVTVDAKQQAIPNLKVYDLLVYGSSTSDFDLDEVSGTPVGVTSADLTPSYNQKYIDASLVGAYSLVVHPILQDGVRVADLLEFSGFSTDSAHSFQFKTQIVNPNIYAGNQDASVWNTATLFSANKKLNAAPAEVVYQSRILGKEMLKREAMADPAAGVNERTPDAAKGFDYEEKAVIFRLCVNASGMDLTGLKNAAGTALGRATVVDTLPAGWEFVNIVEGRNYLLFAGSGDEDGVITAAGSAISSLTGFQASFVGRTATFTFDSLTQPYVILVKAKPTDPSGYFSTNKETTERNQLSLSMQNWTPGVSRHQDVTITSQLLGKSLDIPQVGVLRWTVDYRPYDLPQPGIKIADTLPEGIELRTDAMGALLLDGNITVHELTLKADGSYDVGDPVELSIDENISYDNEKRILSFQIPNSAQAYRFSYLTDVTGEPGEVENEVSLYGSESEQESTSAPYVITAADGEASMKINGSIRISKTDGSGDPLSGVEFTLFAADGETVIRKGVTDGDGNLKFKVLPDGDFILRETATPDDYLSEGIDHYVSVSTTGTTVTTSIDGNTGVNAITIRNYLEGTVGQLTISKVVSGNAADKTKVFDFTVTLFGTQDVYSYIGTNIANGTIRSGETISLSHGQSITIVGLPKEMAYEVTEADYKSEGYSQRSEGESGIIVADETMVAKFTNSRNLATEEPGQQTGSLIVSKTVNGAGADTTKKFDFIVTFSNASGSYSYTGNGVPNGTIQSGDTISLAHGQSITITGLPVGAGYQVKEVEASALGYAVDNASIAGKISGSQARTAAFTNTKLPDSTGGLKLSKTVTGQDTDLSKKFTFTITFSDTTDAYPYTGALTGTIRSGETIALSHGESITITGLPDGTQYTVTEVDYSSAGYTASSSGAAGSIAEGTVSVASFTNKWTGVTPEDPNNNIDEDGTPTGPKDGDANNGGTADTPETGDTKAAAFAKMGLLIFTLAFVLLAVADRFLRRKDTAK